MPNHTLPLVTQMLDDIEAKARADERHKAAKETADAVERAAVYERALWAVLNRHRPYRIYDDCDHRHTSADAVAGTAVMVEAIGLVCEEGYLYDICRECHAEEDFGQTEDACDAGLRYPCPTVVDIETVLGAGVDLTTLAAETPETTLVGAEATRPVLCGPVDEAASDDD